MRARTHILTLAACILAAAPFSAQASVVLYSQPDDSGTTTSREPNFVTAHIDSASIGTPYLGKGPLTLTFTMQDPHAGDGLGYPGGVALGSCRGCADLQTYHFTDVDRSLLADGQFHTFSVETASTTIGLADGTNPVYVTFFNLSQFEGSTVVKANASGTIPAITIEANQAPPPIIPPSLPPDATTVYAQTDASGSMTSSQPTNLNAYVDSASLGDLALGQGPLYLIFTIQDQNAGVTGGAPGGVCLESATSTDCSDPLQRYYFTDTDRAILSDKAAHTFLVETGSTTSAYADGTQPVSIGFFGLTQINGGTKIKADAGGTIPALTIATVAPPPPPAPAVDSVLFIPGTETSRLYYRDSLGIEHELWEPANAAEIPKLAMKSDGTSVNDIYTKDVIDHLYGNRGLWGALTALGTHFLPSDFEVYGDFETYMNSLVASTTLGMHEWRAYPYDWRYDVRDIVTDGTLTETGSAVSRVYLEDVIDQMASSSATGKVAIVAHSNGGLIAKALMQKLEADGKGSLVDKLVFVGTPQWGTPSDLGVMLHGDGYTLPPMLGLITYGGDVRQAAETMPGPYDLLPSPAYFAHVHDPVAVFAGDDSSAPFKAAFAHGITSFAGLVSFVTDAFNLDAGVGDASLLNTPLALDPSLVSKAEATHAELDAWTPPASLQVTAIAGWGQLTDFSYAYTATPGHTVCASACSRDELFIHTPLRTDDGDGTVVSPSAVGDVNDAWYFNAADYVHQKKVSILHQDLTSAVPIQHTLLDLLEGKPVSEDYMVSTKPPAQQNPLTIVGGMSPINLLATDSAGNETGIVPLPGTDFYYAKQDIPGSAVNVSGNEKFIALPQGGQYSISFSGYDSGPANVLVETISGDGTVTSSTTVADLPVTASSTGSFSLDSSSVMSAVAFDASGDGVEERIEPTMGTLVAYEPPTASAPVTPPVPAPTGANSGYSGGGAISIPYIAPTLVPAVATATATATVSVPELPATSTSPVTTSTPLVATSTAPLASSRPPTPPPSAAPLATTTDSSQTAAAVNALSQAGQSGALAAVYYWFVQEWTAFGDFLARIL